MTPTLFTSDISGLDLPIPPRNLRLVLPSNRKSTEKVLSVEEWAILHHIPYCYQQPRFEAAKTHMEGTDPYPQIYGDYGVSWFYTMLFDSVILSAMPIVNFHAGPPGPHALKKALARGDKYITCFWHQVDNTVDDGKVLISKAIELKRDFAKAREDIIRTGIELYSQLRGDYV